MLSGLIGCLLPSLEEQDTSILNEVFSLLEKINAMVGNKFFISTMWLILLKNSKNRLAGFKILNKKFENISNPTPFEFDLTKRGVLQPELINIYNNIRNNNHLKSSFFPNPSMVANALAKCLEDKDVFIKKTCLDFCIKFINFEDNQLFTDHHRLIINAAILRLFENNDISIAKRIAKLWFNHEDLKNVDIDQIEAKKISLISESFRNVLKREITNVNESRLSFIILEHIGFNNELLMEKILDYNSFDFFYYCFKHSIDTQQEWNKEINECITSFISNNSKVLHKIIQNFQKKMKEKKDLIKSDFLEFNLNFLVNPQFRLLDQLMLIHTLLEISLNSIKILFSKEVKLEQNSEKQVIIGNKFEKSLSFVIKCINEMEKMLSLKSSKVGQDQVEAFKDLENQFCDFLEIFINDKKLLIFFLEYFQTYFKMLIMLNNIVNSDPEGNLKITSPKWYFIIFKFLAISNERVIYHVLKFLYDMFELEKDYPILKKYQFFIYQTPDHYEANQLCHLIFHKIFEIFEISDFKELCLHYYLKFVRINFKFVSKSVAEILEEKTAQNFVKISLLWNYTSNFTNSDCMLVLQDSVFLMLDHAESQNPILLNHFKNWLMNSNSSFRIILDSLLKRILKFTNFVKKENKILYNFPFNCKEFIKVLQYIDILMRNCKSVFIHFLPIKEVSNDFDFFIKEVDFILGNLFELKIKEGNSYLVFLIKIMLRYFIAGLNTEIGIDNAQNHQDEIFLVKEKISELFETIISHFKSKNEDLVIQIGVKLIPFLLLNLEKSFLEDQITSQLVYINTISFLFFETKISGNEKTKAKFDAIMMNDKTIDIFVLGLKNKHSFIVKEFVVFFNKFNYILNNNMTSQNLTKLAERILFSYLDSLTSKYSIDLSLKEEEIIRGLIKILLDGLNQFLEFYFKEIKEKTIRKNTTTKIFTFGLGGKDELVINFKKDQKTCEKLLYHFETIFQRFLVVWKDIEIIKDFKIFYKFEKNQLYTKDINLIEIYGINKSIIEIIEPLCFNFKDKIVEVLLIRWLKNNNILLPSNIYHSDVNIENIKVLEMILHLNIPALDFLEELKNSSVFKVLEKLKRYKNISNKKTFHLIREDAVYESNLLSFLYCYLKYSKIEEKEYSKIYETIFQILKCFDNSYTPSTLLLILDIIVLLLEKCELNSNDHYRLISNNSIVVSDILNKLIRILVGDYTIIYSESKKSFDVILPLNPSVWNLAEEKISRILKKKIVNSELDIMFDFVNLKENSTNELRYKFFIINSFLKNFIDLANFYFVNSNNSIYNPNKIRIFFEKIWKIFLKRNKSDMLILEHTSELIYRLISENHLFVNEFKNEILEIFEGDQFFDCSIETVKIWSRILDKFFMETITEMLDKYFDHINFSSLFRSKNTENKYRIKSFQRICFIIFSGEKEKYLNKNKLKIFLEKIREVLKDETVHPNLIIMILFSLRILILRLKKETLNNLFKSMWPSILFLLDKLIKSSKWEKNKNNEILIAALKLLELISFSDIEEFNLHRWAFLFEYFGISININKNNKYQQEIDSPFVINPVLTAKLPKGSKINYLFDDSLNQNDIMGSNRRILIVKNQLHLDRMEETIYHFLNYWILLSRTDMEIDYEEMENLIIGDFIDFQQFVDFK